MYLLDFFSALQSLITVSFLGIPPETITLQTTFKVNAMYANLLDTV